MQAPDSNPEPPEGINNPRASGISEFVKLAGGLGAAAVLIAAVLVTAIGWVAPWVPFSWERAVAGDIDPVSTETEPAAEGALQRLTEELARAARLPDRLSLEVHLSPQSAPNAFATLGGHIVVTRGLVEAVSCENALAMVLAHEIAHIERRHPIQAVGRAATLNLVWAVLGGATGKAAVQEVLGRAGLLTVLRFNREMERNADRDALATLQRHYGHTRGAAALFRQLQKRTSGGPWADFLRSHPRPAERIEAIARRTRDGEAELAPLPAPLAALGGGDSAQ